MLDDRSDLKQFRDTAPCRMTGVTLHGVVFLERLLTTLLDSRVHTVDLEGFVGSKCGVRDQLCTT